MSRGQSTSQVELVGQKIRRIRRTLRLDVEDFAQQLGMPAADLIRLEKGQYRLSLDSLLHIISKVGLSLEELTEEAAREIPTPASRP